MKLLWLKIFFSHVRKEFPPPSRTVKMKSSRGCVIKMWFSGRFSFCSLTLHLFDFIFSTKLIRSRRAFFSRVGAKGGRGGGNDKVLLSWREKAKNVQKSKIVIKCMFVSDAKALYSDRFSSSFYKTRICKRLSWGLVSRHFLREKNIAIFITFARRRRRNDKCKYSNGRLIFFPQMYPVYD